MFGSRTTRIRRARLVPIALTTAALSSAVLGASVTGTLSAFQASITNSTNTATAGSLVMAETNSNNTTTCLSSSGVNNNYAACDGINKYGGVDTPFIPDATHTQTVYFGNAGTSAVRTFTVKPSACSVSSSTRTGNQSTGNLCDSLQLTVTCTPVDTQGHATGSPTTVYDAKTLSSIANTSVDLGALSPSCVPQASTANAVQFVFAVHMPQNQDNTVQGQTVSQPILWTFTGA